MTLTRIFSCAILLMTMSHLSAQSGVVTDELRIATGTMVASNCGDPVSYQGYDYATVLIGEQCWFAENLRSENYDNGDAIPAGLSNSQWSSTTSGATAVYDESASNLETYGRLYNWYAVDDARGICPTGWHVPTDEEWTVMTDFLGGVSIAGSQMKSSTLDTPPWNGTNSSGFSGLPGGTCLRDGSFGLAGDYGQWWSSSPFNYTAWHRGLWNGLEIDNSDQDYLRKLGVLGEKVDRDHDYLQHGFSVRCVRDAEAQSGVVTDELLIATGTMVASNCGDPVSYQGYDYATVLIGEQCWFAENLEATSYRNGDAIQNLQNNAEWTATDAGSVGAWCDYENDDSHPHAYGHLYNWYAVNDSRGLCPNGWHVPSDGEWTQLTAFLGGARYAGTPMKASPQDSPRWNGTNSSGFSGLPGGNRDHKGFFYDAGSNGYWWSSSPFTSKVLARSLLNYYEKVDRLDLWQWDYYRQEGYSVRCVRDAE